MKKLHAERLLQVVRVLEELPKEKKFSLSTWLRCGTNGCAVGWAASDPWFTRRGLKMVYHDWYEPYYKDKYNNDAVCDFFGLDQEQTFDLFYKNSYNEPTKRNHSFRISAMLRG